MTTSNHSSIEIYEILENLGLTASEIKTYIALLEFGKASAGKIIERTGLQNSVVHRALNSLISKGLVSYTILNTHRIYQASDPKSLVDYIDYKKKQLLHILPELEKRREKLADKHSIEIFQGKKGIFHLYNKLLKSGGKEYNTFGGGSDVTYNIMGQEWWLNIHQRRIKLGIPSRQVFDETIREFGEKLNALPLTKIKFLPPEHAQFQETVIIADYVGITIFTEDPYGILIKDKNVAAGYKKQFELLWNIANP